MSEEEKLDIDNKLNIRKRPYFLYLGTVEPRKNIIGIIKAFECFKESYNTDHILVIAGKMGWKTQKIIDTVNSSKYKKDIIFTGYINQIEKDFLLQDAVAFLFPSNYEGFGMPVIEAFSYGCPVITVRDSSLPEVGGDIAFYADSPNNIGQLADLMFNVQSMSQEELIKYAELSREWSMHFEWETCSRKTQSILQGNLE